MTPILRYGLIKQSNAPKKYNACAIKNPSPDWLIDHISGLFCDEAFPVGICPVDIKEYSHQQNIKPIQ
jgi:hypothetical protein